MKDKISENIERLQLRKKKVATKSNIVTLLRLLTFLMIAAAGWFTFGTAYFIPSLLLFIALFLFTVRTDAQLKREKNILINQIHYFRRELNALDHDTRDEPAGEEYINPDHPYAADLDVFGSKGFFPLVNRSGSEPGKNYLAELLLNFETDKNTIKKRVELVKHIAPLHELRSRFYAEMKQGRLTGGSFKALKGRLGSDRKMYQLGLILPAVYSVFTIALIAAVIAGAVSADKIVYWLAAGFLASKLILKNQSADFNQFINDAEQLSVVGKSAALLKELPLDEALFGSDKNESLRGFEVINKTADLAESRANLLVSVLLNGLFLWDLFLLYRLRGVHNEHRNSLAAHLERAVRFDAWNGAGAYAARYPEKPYAELTAEGVRGRKTGHPLIPEDKCVTNDFELTSNQKFTIVTGANMAGKSTFLRTVGVNMIAGMAGIPVTAESFAFEPVQVFSSMRTSDDLGEGESYFFAELKRLSSIVKRAENGEKLFLILDEILKGTNSKDKADGSKRFLKKLMQFDVRGIIATHDLSLCDLENDFPDRINNAKFEIDYQNGELHFDYQLLKGRCENMNATFLMEDMGLVDKR